MPDADRTPSAASSCDQPMRGIYGAVTICARPAGHTGKHDPIWNHKDWPEASSAAQDRFKPVLMRTRTRVVERTNLETDGENWRGRCSCGWKTPIFRRRKTAERHVNLHYEARANG